MAYRLNPGDCIQASLFGCITMIGDEENAFDLHKELIDWSVLDAKLNIMFFLNNFNDAMKTEDKDMPVLALIPKVIPIEIEYNPPLTEVSNHVNAIESLQSISEAAAIIGEAWQLVPCSLCTR
jgi:hypothetical protein